MTYDPKNAAPAAPLAAVPDPEPAPDRRDVGFELDGRYYRLTFALGHPKDLLLLDRLSGGRSVEILAAIDTDDDDPDRFGITWTLVTVATSIRAAHPEWTVERVYDRVMRIDDLDTELVWVGGEADAPADPTPLPAEGSEATTPSSSSSAGESSSSPTPADS